MGDVIDFKPKNKRKINLKFDRQLLLEVAIVKLWGMLRGFNLIYPIEEYHIVFLQFSDLCFQFMNENEIIVYDDALIETTDNAKDKLKQFIKEKEEKYEL